MNVIGGRPSHRWRPYGDVLQPHQEGHGHVQPGAGGVPQRGAEEGANRWAGAGAVAVDIPGSLWIHFLVSGGDGGDGVVVLVLVLV